MYVNAIPAHRVAQIHIAGHSRYEKYILDTHDHPVIDPVWELYARAIERCGPTPTLLEWDDHIPSFDEVHAEALKANRCLHKFAKAESTVFPLLIPRPGKRSWRLHDEFPSHEPRPTAARNGARCDDAADSR